MITVNVATLKEKLSFYLNLVKRGQEVVVTSYKDKVARILPVSSGSVEPVEPSRPVSDLKKLKGVKRSGVSAVDLLIEDRGRR